MLHCLVFILFLFFIAMDKILKGFLLQCWLAVQLHPQWFKASV